jgi:transcriptional regulator with XRE-family HTH domain
MMPEEIKRLRLAKEISLLELSAMIGLPADYIRDIEDRKVVALDSDLERLGKALRTAKTNRREK